MNWYSFFAAQFPRGSDIGVCDANFFIGRDGAVGEDGEREREEVEALRCVWSAAEIDFTKIPSVSRSKDTTSENQNIRMRTGHLTRIIPPSGMSLAANIPLPLSPASLIMLLNNLSSVLPLTVPFPLEFSALFYRLTILGVTLRM